MGSRNPLVRVFHLAMCLEEHLAELDINPLMVLPRTEGLGIPSSAGWAYPIGNYCLYRRFVPTNRRFAVCKIAIYADDHLPPHFHIEGRGFRAIVEIATINVGAGDVRGGE